MIRRLLAAWARRHADDLDEPLNIPEPDPRDAQLHQARRQLADAQAVIAELAADVTDLTATVGQRTSERDALADELERTKAQLAEAHHALAGGRHLYTERAVETPPPPVSDRAEALRERARADGLARRLAEAEAELHALRYPRIPATSTVQGAR